MTVLSSPVPVMEVVEGIEQLIPSFRGVKFSGMDLMDLGQCVMHSQPQWSILYGVDEVSLTCTIAGAPCLLTNRRQLLVGDEELDHAV